MFARAAGFGLLFGLVLATQGAAVSLELTQNYIYEYTIDTSSSPNLLYGSLTLTNYTCWAGIGLSTKGTMAAAELFLIGDQNGMYFASVNSTAPMGHAPPIKNQDQGGILSINTNFDDGMSQFNFTTTEVFLTKGSLVWAHCDTDNTLSMSYHGMFHGSA